jgi:hypothetical protein
MFGWNPPFTIDEDVDVDFDLVPSDRKKQKKDPSLSEQVAALGLPTGECYFCGTPGFSSLRAVTRTREGHPVCEHCHDLYKRK